MTAPSKPDLLRTIAVSARAHEDHAFLSLWLATACKDLPLHTTEPGSYIMRSHNDPRGPRSTFTCWTIRIGQHALSLSLTSVSNNDDAATFATTVEAHVSFLGPDATLTSEASLLGFRRATTVDTDGEPIPTNAPWPWHLSFGARPDATSLQPSKLADHIPLPEHLPLTLHPARLSALEALTKRPLTESLKLRGRDEVLVCLLAALNAMVDRHERPNP